MSQDNSGRGGPALPKRLRNTALRGQLSLISYTQQYTVTWLYAGGWEEGLESHFHSHYIQCCTDSCASSYSLPDV